MQVEHETTALMYLVEIFIFPLYYHVIIEPTKIFNDLLKYRKIQNFFLSLKNITLGDQLMLVKVFENFDY